MSNDELESFQMRAPLNLLQAVDHWRAKQQDIPSRDEAICRLVNHSLKLASASGDQQERMAVWDADVARLNDALP